MVTKFTKHCGVNFTENQHKALKIVAEQNGFTLGKTIRECTKEGLRKISQEIKLVNGRILRQDAMWEEKDLESYISMMDSLAGINDISLTKRILLEFALAKLHPVFLNLKLDEIVY